MEDDMSDFSRPQMYLFGCTLRSDKREFKVDLDDEDTEQQLSLKAVCLGAEAEDKFHVVEVEGIAYDAKTSKVPIAVLKPSVLPSMNLGGFEITPPVTFRLVSGSGPVHISGQHFVSVKGSEDEEEENNTSPVKRPANQPLLKKTPQKKFKIDSDDEDDDDDDEEDSDEDEDDDDESDEEDVKPQKNVAKALQKSPELIPKKPNKTPVKQNGPAEKSSGPAAKPQIKTPGKHKSQAGPPKTFTLPDIKNKLSSAAKEGKPLPKTEQKFENFVRTSYKVTDKKVVKDLWSFLQTLKTEKK
ncbi:nucleophosmin-like isoform X1 [Poeciliopsis prolifica]|uniref:nucleophosmin-like isoform X1 n=1 Tax=Poeciliopsis prolifica TaxID=188132 RepID=UPI0024134C7D|nr:nucleophosmin-like isoform X1 [Poeciliopsis prolifica]XP_054886763.1 nucleophosmin-like isoform X1 [Poeciliopsis prolifica]